MTTVRAETLNSLWTFDFDSMIMSRVPKVGETSAMDHPTLKYTDIGKPMPFTTVKYNGFFIEIVTPGRHLCTAEVINIDGEIPEH